MNSLSMPSQNSVRTNDIKREKVLIPLTKEESQKTDEDSFYANLCRICFEERSDTMFLPCAHLVACAKCASSVNGCPICRKKYTELVKVYFA